MIDIVLYDSLAPFSTRETARGGSDLHLIQLAEQFEAMGYSAVIARGDGFPINVRCLPASFSGNARCIPASDIMSASPARAIILNRASRLPFGFKADRIVVHALDIYSHAMDCHLPLLTSGRAVLVCVSTWLTHLYPHAKVKHAIQPPIDPLEPLPPKEPGLFVYASAPWKGLPETLFAWEAIRPRLPRAAHLKIVSPGYADETAPMIPPGVEWVRDVSPEEYRRIVASAEGLFYVNIAPETYCVLAQMADIYGTRPHILCPDRAGMIDTSRRHMSRTFDDFAWDVVRNYGKPPVLIPNQYTPERIAKRWAEVLFA